VALREPRCLEGRLNIHLEIDHVGDELRVGLRLVPTAHDPERDPRVALLRKGRDDRVQGTLVPGQQIW